MTSLHELKDSFEKLANRENPASRFLTQTANTLKETTRQAKEAANTVAITADKAIDAATVSAQHTRDSLTATLEQTLQSTNELRSTTSDAIQTAINSSVNDWLNSHPVVLRMVQALLWATNHPILSLVIFLISVALAWSLIKALGRLIEIAGLSLLKAPFMLSVGLIGVGSRTLRRFAGASKQLPALQLLNYEKDKQQRLAEISTRLEALSQEQNELLQEAATILAAKEVSNGSVNTAPRSLS